MAEVKVERKYSIDNLTYEQIETIYRALMVFEPEYLEGKKAKKELTKALEGWV